MIGFIRNEGVKTSLGIGEFDPLFKKLKEVLEDYSPGKHLWSSERMNLVQENNIKWKHIIDRGGGNCHSLIGIPSIEVNNNTMNFLKNGKYMLKKDFLSNNCKLISIESFIGKHSILKKYEIKDDPKMIIVIKYAKLK